MRMKLRSTAALVLSALLVSGGAVRAQQEEAGKLTPDERREAGEFLLRLDERWREARDFDALFDEVFVGDYMEISRADADTLSFLPLGESLRGQLSAAELRRAHVAGLNFVYVLGRLSLTFDLREKSRRRAERAAASPRPDGGEPSGEAAEDAEYSAEEDDADPSFAELLSPAVVEELKSSAQMSAAILGGDGGEGKAGAHEELEITTHEQLDVALSALERATPKMRARVRELETDLPGAPVSAVPREDEGEGELPDLSLSSAEAESKNRPAGTRVVAGYISFLQVLLVKEGGRYKVLGAYLLAD